MDTRCAAGTGMGGCMGTRKSAVREVCMGGCMRVSCAWAVLPLICLMSQLSFTWLFSPLAYDATSFNKLILFPCHPFSKLLLCLPLMLLSLMISISLTSSPNSSALPLQRIDQLFKWISDTYPRVFWLSGFTYPTGFLTAVLQVGRGASSD